MKKSPMLTDEQIVGISNRLVAIIDKWHSGIWSTDANYEYICAENEIFETIIKPLLIEKVDYYSKIIREIFDYKCEECSTPGFTHLVIPVKEVKKYLED